MADAMKKASLPSQKQCWLSVIFWVYAVALALWSTSSRIHPCTGRRRPRQTPGLQLCGIDRVIRQHHVMLGADQVPPLKKFMVKLRRWSYWWKACRCPRPTWQRRFSCPHRSRRSEAGWRASKYCGPSGRHDALKNFKANATYTVEEGGKVLAAKPFKR